MLSIAFQTSLDLTHILIAKVKEKMLFYSVIPCFLKVNFKVTSLSNYVENLRLV